MSDKTEWEGRGQRLRDSRWGQMEPPPQALRPAKEMIPRGVYNVGLLGAKTEIPTHRESGQTSDKGST